MKTHPTPRFASFRSIVTSILLLNAAAVARASAGAYVPAPAAPTISEQPAGISLHQGDTFTLGVTASAYPAPGYQWMKNGVNVPGASSEKFTVPSAPVSQTVPRGGTARFELQAAGSPAPAYQWRKDGRNLPGATTSVLTLADVQPSDEGSYDVYLSNTRGAVLSPAATLHVIDASSPPPGSPTAAAEPPPATVSAPSTRILAPLRTAVPARAHPPRSP